MWSFIELDREKTEDETDTHENELDPNLMYSNDEICPHEEEQERLINIKF